MTLFREAREEDLPAIVALLADDRLGAAREAGGADLDPAYLTAFRAITADPAQVEYVAELKGIVVGCLQLSILPGLGLRGALRGQIESVRVASDRRGQGIGGDLIRFAVEQARARGCRMVQLTSDSSRKDAHRFYERLGFAASHVGFKLAL